MINLFSSVKEPRVATRDVVALLTFIVLNFADLISTNLALRHGFIEGNPLMRMLLNTYGFASLVDYKLFVIGTVFLGTIWLSGYHRKLSYTTLLICNALIGLAVVVNLVQFL